MKDQFANYVVQKVLETCDDQQLEMILNRIKVHLNALKKYTYGKHIVARVEKLVAAGGIFALSSLAFMIARHALFNCKVVGWHIITSCYLDVTFLYVMFLTTFIYMVYLS